MWAYHIINTKRTTLNSIQKMSDDTWFVLQHRQPTVSIRSPLQHTFQAIGLPGNSTRRTSTADRRSHGSHDPAHSPDVLEYSEAARMPSELADGLPQLVRSSTMLNQRSTNRWGRTTVGSATSITRTRWVLKLPSVTEQKIRVETYTIRRSMLNDPWLTTRMLFKREQWPSRLSNL